MLFSRILTFVSLAIVGSCGVAAMANPVTTVVKRQTTVTALLGTLAGGVETEVATILTAAQLPGESLTGLGTLINALESTINTAVGNIEALGSGTITDSSDVTTIANELVAMVQDINSLVLDSTISSSEGTVAALDSTLAGIISATEADVPGLQDELASELTSAGITATTLTNDGLSATASLIF